MNTFEIIIIIANIILSIILGCIAILTKNMIVKIIATILLIVLVLFDFIISAWYMTLVYFRTRNVDSVSSYNRILKYVVIVFWIFILILILAIVLIIILAFFASPTLVTTTEAIAATSGGVTKSVELVLLIVLIFCFLVNIFTGAFCFVIAYMYSTTDVYVDKDNTNNAVVVNGVNNLILGGVISIITFIVIIVIFVIRLLLNRIKKTKMESDDTKTRIQ